MTQRKKPPMLIILDGWGYREAKEENAILRAIASSLNNLKEKSSYPWFLRNPTPGFLEISEKAAGLPEEQVRLGSLESEHRSQNANRVIYEKNGKVSGCVGAHPDNETWGVLTHIPKFQRFGTTMRFKYYQYKRSESGYLIEVEIDIVKEVIIPCLWLPWNYYTYLKRLLEYIFQLNLKVPA